MEGGIAGVTHPHNLEQFYITRRKTLTKYVDENLKIFFYNFLKSITCQSLSLFS